MSSSQTRRVPTAYEIREPHILGRAIFGVLGCFGHLAFGVWLSVLIYLQRFKGFPKSVFVLRPLTLLPVAMLNFAAAAFALISCSKFATPNTNRITAILLVLASLSCHSIFGWKELILDHFIKVFMAYLLLLNPRDPRFATMRPFTSKIRRD